MILAGIRVLDVGSFVAGPAAATVMGDFGAEVIKIEPPEGDPYRSLHRLPGSPEGDRDYYWVLDSRNKKGLALDLKRPEAREVLERLVRSADVFLTNMPLDVRARLGIRWADLEPLNGRLVYASLTAYGESGPEANKTGFDATAWWARTGLMDNARSGPDAPPARSIPGMGDHATAMALFGAVMMALYQRERTGKGGMVSTSLMAAGLWSNAHVRPGASLRRRRPAAPASRAGAECPRQHVPVRRRPLVHPAPPCRRSGSGPGSCARSSVRISPRIRASPPWARDGSTCMAWSPRSTRSSRRARGPSGASDWTRRASRSAGSRSSRIWSGTGRCWRAER